jgi:hypothetical protein
MGIDNGIGNPTTTAHDYHEHTQDAAAPVGETGAGGRGKTEGKSRLVGDTTTAHERYENNNHGEPTVSVGAGAGVVTSHMDTRCVVRSQSQNQHH